MPDNQSSVRAVVGVTVFYMCSALIMVMTNKWVLNSSSLPLTFLFLQLSLSVLCLSLLSLLPPTHRFVFHPPKWTSKTITAVAPVCTVNVVGLVFNILCLKLVDASYFQVARGLTLPMTVVLQSLMTGERPTMGTIGSCGLVTWGFTYAFFPAPFFSSFATSTATTPPFTAADPSSTLYQGAEAPMLGMIFGVLSAAMVAIHAVLIKASLKNVDGKTLDLAYWQNALSALALIPAIAVSGELGGLFNLVVGREGNFSAFIAGSILTGIVGFLICIAGLLSIKVTSPVTHMFSSAVRSVLQTMLGVWLFKDVINTNRAMSILLILAGSTLYTYLKSRSLPAPSSPKQSEQQERQDRQDRQALLKEEMSSVVGGDAEKGLNSGPSLGARSKRIGAETR